MRQLFFTLLVVILSSPAMLAQEVQAENIVREPMKKAQHIEKSTDHDVFHVYICQRCGTENLVNWSMEGEKENLELIPHCTFCGKKYWPKFKPSGFLQRSYCHQVTLRKPNI